MLSNSIEEKMIQNVLLGYVYWVGNNRKWYTTITPKQPSPQFFFAWYGDGPPPPGMG